MARFTLRARYLLVAVLAQSNVAAAQPPDTSLVLTEVAAWTVPDGLELTGLSVADAGDLVVWGSGTPYLVVIAPALSSSRTVQLPSGVSPVAAHLFPDGTIEVISREPAMQLRTGDGGASWIAQGLHPNSVAIEATWWDGGWLCLTEDWDGLLRVETVGRDGQHTARPVRSDATSRRVYGFLRASGGAIVMTEMAAPHRFGFLDPLTGSLAWVGNANDVLTRHSPAAHGAWVGLPVLSLGARFLQTLADLTSDQRLIVLYDAEGGVMRDTLLDVPLGFYESRPDLGMLYGARRTDRVEVVKYQWQWSDGAGDRQ